MKPIVLDVPRFEQEYMTCVPSSLQQIMAYYGEKQSLSKILKEIKVNKDHGVWEFQIGTYAVMHGFKAMIYHSAIKIFDMSWDGLSNPQLLSKLKQRVRYERDPMFKDGIKHAIEYLLAGGRVKFRLLNKNHIIEELKKGIPIITFVCSQIHFNSKRKYKGNPDDIRGKEGGHAFVVSGYKDDKFQITDPSKIRKKKYWLDADDLIANINNWMGRLIVITR